MLSILKRLVGVGKKIFLVLVVYTVIIGLFFSFTNKKPVSSTQDYIKYNRARMYKVMNDPQLNKTKEGKASITIVRAITCAAIGETCTKNPADGDKYYEKSILGYTGKLMSIPFTNPPASGVAWVQNSLENAGFVPKTYAAEGIGFATIKPFIGLWKALRDVAYLGLVLVIVAIGFMIMFRMKLNPQTVISVENSLPNIVVSLLLITFSYAIAGFLIDLMYLFIVILISIFARVNGGNVLTMTASYIQASPLDIIDKVLGGHGFFGNMGNLIRIPTDLLKLPGEGFYWMIQAISSALVGWIWVIPMMYNFLSRFFINLAPTADMQPAGVGISWNILGALADVGIGLPVSIVIGMLLSFVFLNLILGLLILISVLFIFYRIFFMLLSTYIKIIILVVASPILLLFNAIPGRNVFGAWFSNLFVEIMTFPVLVAIFLLGSYLSQIPMNNAQLFTPPFFANINPETLSFLLGMGLLFMAPDLVDLVKKLLLPKPLPMPDVGPGVFFGGVTTGVSGGLGEVQKYATLGYYVKPLGAIMSKIPGINVAAPQHPGGGK